MPLVQTQMLSGCELKRLVSLEPNQTLEDEVLCVHCKGILVSPVSCQTCEALLCSPCGETLVSSGDPCVCGSPFLSQKPHNIIKRLLSNYKFLCPHSQTGCPSRLSVDQIDSHCSTCLFQPSTCPFSGCQMAITLGELKLHKAECGFKPSSCPHCGEVLLWKSLASHERGCSLKPASCPGCNAQLLLSQLESHTKTCQKIEVCCEECSQRIRREALPLHTEDQCLSFLYEQIHRELSSETVKVRQLLSHLHLKFSERDGLSQTKCQNCRQLSCEVNRRNCESCRRGFCGICAKKALRFCRKCQGSCCGDCLVKGEVCTVCSECKGKGTKKV